MNSYELIMKLQQKMQDPKFVEQFNKMAAQLQNIPGLEQEVIRIAQIEDNKKRQKALDKLPDKVKMLVGQMVNLINE